jgi:hypothetical protein
MTLHNGAATEECHFGSEKLPGGLRMGWMLEERFRGQEVRVRTPLCEARNHVQFCTKIQPLCISRIKP